MKKEVKKENYRRCYHQPENKMLTPDRSYILCKQIQPIVDVDLHCKQVHQMYWCHHLKLTIHYLRTVDLHIQRIQDLHDLHYMFYFYNINMQASRESQQVWYMLYLEYARNLDQHLDKLQKIHRQLFHRLQCVHNYINEKISYNKKTGQ